MSFRKGTKASTPIDGSGKSSTVILPRAGVSTSISSVDTSSVEERKKINLSPEFDRRKLMRYLFSSSSDDSEPKRRIPSSSRKANQTTSKRSVNVRSDDEWETTWEDTKSVRDVPTLTENIRTVGEEPLFSVPKNVVENVDNDSKYLQVPALESPLGDCENAVDDDIFDTGSDESGELQVQRPLKTYKGPGPRQYISPKKLTPGATDFDWSSFPNYEANRLWNKYMARDAKRRYERLRSMPEKKSIRNREIMLAIRKEGENEKKAVKHKMKKKPRGKTRERPSSPEMTTIYCNGLFSADGDVYSAVDSDPYEMEETRDKREEFIPVPSTSNNQESSNLKSNKSRKRGGSSSEDSSVKMKKRRRVYKLNSSTGNSSIQEPLIDESSDDDIMNHQLVIEIVGKSRLGSSLSVQTGGVSEVSTSTKTLITDVDENINPSRSCRTMEETRDKGEEFIPVPSTSKNHESSNLKSNKSRKRGGSSSEDSSVKMKKRRRVYKLNSSTRDSSIQEPFTDESSDDDIINHQLVIEIVGKSRSGSSLSVQKGGVDQISTSTNTLINEEMEEMITDVDENVNPSRSCRPIPEETDNWDKSLIGQTSSRSSPKLSRPRVRCNVPFFGPLWKVKKDYRENEELRTKLVRCNVPFFGPLCKVKKDYRENEELRTKLVRSNVPFIGPLWKMKKDYKDK